MGDGTVMGRIRDLYIAKKLAGGGGGGGGGGAQLIATGKFTVKTSSTTEIDVGTLDAGASAVTNDKMLLVTIRAENPYGSYIYGSDCFACGDYQYNKDAVEFMEAGYTTFDLAGGGLMNALMGYGVDSSRFGVYAKSVNSSGVISIKAKYDASKGMIDDIFDVKAYLIDWVDNVHS